MNYKQQSVQDECVYDVLWETVLANKSCQINVVHANEKTKMFYDNFVKVDVVTARHIEKKTRLQSYLTIRCYSN